MKSKQLSTLVAWTKTLSESPLCIQPHHVICFRTICNKQLVATSLTLSTIFFSFLFFSLPNLTLEPSIRALSRNLGYFTPLFTLVDTSCTNEMIDEQTHQRLSVQDWEFRTPFHYPSPSAFPTGSEPRGRSGGYTTASPPLACLETDIQIQYTCLSDVVQEPIRNLDFSRGSFRFPIAERMGVSCPL